MLAKKNRLDRKTLEEVFKRGRSFSTPLFNFKFLRHVGPSRISFVAPKSVAKKATQRNLLRRKGYGALPRVVPANILGVFVYKKEEKNAKIIKENVQQIFSLANQPISKT